MTNLALLLGLSLVDSIFTGYRAAAGRNPLLHKVDYTLRSFWTGIIFGLGGAFFMAGAAVSCLYWQTRGGRSGLEVVAELNAAALPLVGCYGAFATVVLLVLLLWTYPERQTRELSVVLVLGPCTLVRPYVIGAGAVWASVGVEIHVAALIALAAATQLGVERILERWQLSAQHVRMRQWE